MKADRVLKITPSFLDCLQLILSFMDSRPLTHRSLERIPFYSIRKDTLTEAVTLI